MIDCELTNHPVCPNCGAEYRGELWETLLTTDGATDVLDCVKCGNEYKCTSHVSFSYTTRNLKCHPLRIARARWVVNILRGERFPCLDPWEPGPAKSWVMTWRDLDEDCWKYKTATSTRFCTLSLGRGLLTINELWLEFLAQESGGDPIFKPIKGKRTKFNFFEEQWPEFIKDMLWDADSSENPEELLLALNQLAKGNKEESHADR